jgi:hypothetical protein
MYSKSTRHKCLVRLVYITIDNEHSEYTAQHFTAKHDIAELSRAQHSRTETSLSRMDRFPLGALHVHFVS